MKILITGVNGFVGKHLAREIHSRGIDVAGVGQREAQADPEILDILKEYYQCDITDPNTVALLPLEGIDAVINLAGLANVGASFDNPELYMDVNVKVLSVLGKALHEKNPNARIIAVGTGALYDPNQSMPLSEAAQTVTKSSPYALSKLAMEDAAKELRQLGQTCIVVRPFNHIGPGQGLGFLIPDLAHKLRETDPENPMITAGNLKTVRDFTDVRDIAKAYVDLATSEEPEHTLYNVCSGNGQSGEDIVKALCGEVGINFTELTIETDPALVRPTDPAVIVGNHDRLTGETGWEPTIPLDKTVKDIVTSLWAK